jgi:hypothetical protein
VGRAADDWTCCLYLFTTPLVPDATQGLIDVITNKASLDKVIWHDPSTRLSFLPAGGEVAPDSHQ